MKNQNASEEERPRGRLRDAVLRSSTDTVRDILALVTVIGFVVITAVLAIVFPLFALAKPADMTNYLKDLSSIYSGIVGLIIGYYFGKP